MKIFHRTPWYVAGLAFECQGCGRCCRGPEEGYVWVTAEEIATIARHLKIPEAQMRKKYVRRAAGRYSLVEVKGNRDCVFLDMDEGGCGGCRIYSVRPTQCRTWPFWATNLASADMWAEAGLRCKGINRGRLIDFDEIEIRRRATQE